jgi:uncharacterized membrane protein
MGRWSWWQWLIAVLSLVAFLLSCLLSWHFFAGTLMVGCGGGSPCDQVLSSRWSTIGGIVPVSSLAMGVYLALFIVAFFIGHPTEATIRLLAWKLMLVLAGTITGSALWFSLLQKWMIGQFCPYCLSTHVVGLLLALTILYSAFIKKEPVSREPDRRRNTDLVILSTAANSMIKSARKIGLLAVGFLLSAMLAVAQVHINPSSDYLVGQSDQALPAMDDKNAPLTGPAQAPYKVILLFDYNCSHCQKIHFIMKEAVRRYNGQLAFVMCPTPLNTRCNPYVSRDPDMFRYSCELAKIGLAVWKADSRKFAEFEDWMFSFETGDKWVPRKPDEAMKKAIKLVGKKGLDAALTDRWIDDYAQLCLTLFGKTLQKGQGGIPRLIYRDQWVIPETENGEDFLHLLQTSLQVPTP